MKFSQIAVFDDRDAKIYAQNVISNLKLAVLRKTFRKSQINTVTNPRIIINRFGQTTVVLLAMLYGRINTK